MCPSLLLRLLVGAGISSLLSTAFRPAGHTRFCLEDQHQRGCALRTSAALSTPQRRASAAPSPWHGPPSRTHNRRSSSRHGRPCTVRMNENAGGESDRREFLTRVGAGAVVGGLSSLAVAAGSPAPAGAFCGETYPYWAYYVDFDETFVPFEFEGYSGKVFTRTVGNAKEQKKAQHSPLVIIPGGPGLPHDYLETLEGASKDDRIVVMFDPIGTGNSSALPAGVRANAPDLLSTRSLVAQTNAVLDSLKLTTYHLLGHGTGAEAALELGKTFGRPSPRPPGPEVEAVLSVTLASPVLGGSELPPDFLEQLRAPYTKGGNEAPLCLETALQGQNAESFTGGVAAMKKDRGSRNAPGPLACPVLITYGGRDVIGEKPIADLKEALSGGDEPVETKAFANSGHLPHLDEREDYVTLVQNYITFVDEAWAGKSGGSKK